MTTDQGQHSFVIRLYLPGVGLSYKISLAVECTRLEVDAARLRRAVEIILRAADVRQATISLAVVDDPTIHELNRRYLQHDYATDVLSFVLEQDDNTLEGEVIVSADTAATTADRLNCAGADELLLYVVHGTLHLVGYDDLEPELRAIMRERERAVLAQLGVTPCYESTDEA